MQSLLSATVQSSPSGESTRTYAVENSWTCYVDYDQHHFTYGLEVKRTGPKKWWATHMLLNTNDLSYKPLIGKGSEGTIEVVNDGYAIRLSGEVGFRGWRGAYEGAANSFDQNKYSNMEWTYAWKQDNNTATWKETCWYKNLGAADRLTAKPADTQTLQHTATQSEANAQPKSTVKKTSKPPIDLGTKVEKNVYSTITAKENAQALENQLAEGGQRFGCDGKQIIVTVFGDFVYDHEMDLTTGEKILHLSFTPTTFGPGTAQGQSLDTGLSLKPTLIAPSSVYFYPTSQASQPLNGYREWHWTLNQRFWSSFTKASGDISIEVTPSTEAHAQPPALKLELKGKPWWWPANWFWENIISKPEVWTIAVVFTFIGARKGFREAFLFLWRRIRRQASGGR